VSTTQRRDASARKDTLLRGAVFWGYTVLMLPEVSPCTPCTISLSMHNLSLNETFSACISAKLGTIPAALSPRSCCSNHGVFPPLGVCPFVDESGSDPCLR
jgi:hypothetical protein